MCALLAVSIRVLVVPGVFAIRFCYYRPFFTHGFSGFAASLPPLFFAYAGFESLAQAAEEVKDSTRRLPAIFAKGIAVATLGVLPDVGGRARRAAGGAARGERRPDGRRGIGLSPSAAAWFVGLGAVMALTTSVNSTMLVPSRLAIMLARDRLAPAWIGAVARRTGTPVAGLTLTFAAAALLLLSGQVALALNIAVFALVLLYFLHSFALLRLPRANPALLRSVTVRIPITLQQVSAVVSMLAMGALLGEQVIQDGLALSRLSLRERLANHSLTTIELCAMWAAIGLVIYALGRRRGAREHHDYAAALEVTRGQTEA